MKALGALLFAMTLSGCTLGSAATGNSSIRGELDAPDCWTGRFDLQPDYFAAVPFEFDDSLQIRIQKGGDFQTFSDGVLIVIQEVQRVRARMASEGGSATFKVSLPPGVTPPGVPVLLDPDPARVHLNLFLQRTCRSQNLALHAVEEVALAPGGECRRCPAAAGDGGAEAGAPVSAKSTITFESLFSGNPYEPQLAQRFTKAKFDVYLADPRDRCPGEAIFVEGDGGGAPTRPPLPPCRGHLQGDFQFYFERGRPLQPFP